MSTKISAKSITLAVGVALISLSGVNLANGAENPFTLTDLSSGYMVADNGVGEGGGDKGKEGKCGEGKCGA